MINHRHYVSIIKPVETIWVIRYLAAVATNVELGFVVGLLAETVELLLLALVGCPAAIAHKLGHCLRHVLQKKR